MAHGRGKQSYRDFKAQVRELERLTRSALDAGEYYTHSQVQEWFYDLLDLYELNLQEEQLDRELWYGRANDYIQERLTTIQDDYGLTSEYPTSGDIEDSEEVQEFNESEESELPFNLIDEGECTGSGAYVRGYIITSIEELIEYIQPIPDSAIKGYVPLYSQDGELVGVQPCIGDTE